MDALVVTSMVLVVAGLALVVTGKVISLRRRERPTGTRFASIVVGCLLVGSAVAVLLLAIADRD
jgi:hypothetical protein